MSASPTWVDYILIFIFGFLLPIGTGLRSAALFKSSTLHFNSYSRRRFYLGNSLSLFLMAAVIMVVWLLYGRPMEELGFRLPFNEFHSVTYLLSGLFVFIFLADSLYSSWEMNSSKENLKEFKRHAPFMPTEKDDLPTYLIMCMSAAVFEEIVFRGYLITVVQKLFHSFPAADTMALLIPAILFSIAHYYQGLAAVFKIAVLSFLFGMIYWYSGSLIPVILLHFLVDLMSGLVCVYGVRRDREA